MPTLDLTEPGHLLEKLDYELQALVTDPGNSYAAINAVRDAYHLREWVWHGRLEMAQALQTAIMSTSGNKDNWNKWVIGEFPDFPIIRELCNGSKHFIPGDKINAVHRSGWGSPVPFWGNPCSGWGDKNFYVEDDTGRIISLAGC